MQLIITDEDSCFQDVLKLLNGWPLDDLVGAPTGRIPHSAPAEQRFPLVTATLAPLVNPDLPTVAPQPAAVAAPPTLGAEGTPTRLDVTGMPWDHRIHSEVKKLNSNGTWRLRRNLDPAVHEQVKAEYAAAGIVAASLPGIAPAPAPPVAAAPVPPPPPAAATTAPVPPPPPAAAEPAPMTFAAALEVITGAMTAKKITKDDVNAAVARMGLANLVVLASQPTLIPVLLKELGL